MDLVKRLEQIERQVIPPAAGRPNLDLGALTDDELATLLKILRKCQPSSRPTALDRLEDLARSMTKDELKAAIAIFEQAARPARQDDSE